ncbi:MAG: BON domain-containing protein, partial [Gemmatimonadetes bacterium]|nr:BON domain-containing protein [Gemmatimonadota bacterium]
MRHVARGTVPSLLLVLMGAPAQASAQDAPGQSQDTGTAAALAQAAESQATASPSVEQITEERSGADEQIRNTLQAVFDRVPSLAAVSVQVEAGIVTLAGTVLDATVRDRAVELATAQAGVVWVENDIVLDTSLSRQLKPTWDRLQQLGFDTLARLPLLLIALLIVVLAAWVGGALGRWGGPSWLKSQNPFLRNLVARAIQAAVVLAGLLIALDLLDATTLVG